MTAQIQLGLNYFVKLFVDLTSLDPGSNSNQSVLAPLWHQSPLALQLMTEGAHGSPSELILNSGAAAAVPWPGCISSLAVPRAQGAPEGVRAH